MRWHLVVPIWRFCFLVSLQTSCVQLSPNDLEEVAVHQDDAFELQSVDDGVGDVELTSDVVGGEPSFREEILCRDCVQLLEPEVVPEVSHQAVLFLFLRVIRGWIQS